MLSRLRHRAQKSLRVLFEFHHVLILVHILHHKGPAHRVTCVGGILLHFQSRFTATSAHGVQVLSCWILRCHVIVIVLQIRIHKGMTSVGIHARVTDHVTGVGIHTLRSMPNDIHFRKRHYDAREMGLSTHAYTPGAHYFLCAHVSK